MSRRLVVIMVAVVAASLLLAEVLLRPARADRADLVVILVVPAALAVLATPLLARWVSRRASVAGAVLAVALCSLALGAIATSAASNAMFVSAHDYRLFLVVLLLSSGIAIAVGSQLSRPLAADIRRLGDVAERVAAGDLSVRSGIDRTDEVGSTAAALDQMVGSLADAEAERERLATARRHLFTGVGHDLRTPLAAMRAAVESLQDGVAPDPARYLDVIAAQLATVDGLLDQLIEYARLESGHRDATDERVDVAELADECAEALGPLAARSGVGLTTTVTGHGSTVVRGHPGELARVLRNVVDNAVRHSPSGGTVRLEVVAADPGGSAGPVGSAGSTGSVGPAGLAGSVGVIVHDDGPGFPDELRPHAFDPFTRADPARTPGDGHAGLGLAICAAIVAVHQGRIALGPGPGGDVRIHLPADRTGPTATPQEAP